MAARQHRHEVRIMITGCLIVICCPSNVSQAKTLLFVLHVLQMIPKGLAIAVLAVSSHDIGQQRSILPDSMHPLAIGAAFPSILSHHFFTFYFASLENPESTFQILHAATTASIALQKLHLKLIPVCDNEHVLQLISAACRSAMEITLDFPPSHLQRVRYSQLFAELGVTRSHNMTLASLELTLHGGPCHLLIFDYLLPPMATLSTLQALALTCHKTLKQLPILRTVTAMHTLKLCECR
jgi:hypothetical protein